MFAHFECPLVQRTANPLLLLLLLTFRSLAAFLYEHILRLFLPTRPTNGDTNSRVVYFYTDGQTKIEPEEDVPSNPRQTRTLPPHSRSEYSFFFITALILSPASDATVVDKSTSTWICIFLYSKKTNTRRVSSSLESNHHSILHNATLYERIRPPATICILLFKPPLNSIPHKPQKTTTQQ